MALFRLGVIDSLAELSTAVLGNTIQIGPSSAAVLLVASSLINTLVTEALNISRLPVPLAVGTLLNTVACRTQSEKFNKVTVLTRSTTTMIVLLLLVQLRLPL